MWWLDQVVMKPPHKHLSQYSLCHQLSAPVFNLLNLEVTCLSKCPHLCHDSIHLVLVGLDFTLYQLMGGSCAVIIV